MTTHTLEWKCGYTPCEDCCKGFVDSYKRTFSVDKMHRRVFGFFGDVGIPHTMRVDYITNCPFCGAEFVVKDRGE